eukprot:365557-Chlamydomonas_euryale.AAC.7
MCALALRRCVFVIAADRRRAADVERSPSAADPSVDPCHTASDQPRGANTLLRGAPLGVAGRS